MGKYKQVLEEMYREEMRDENTAPDNKLEFVGDHVFNFTTYDGSLSAKLAKRMIEVIDCILNQSTFEYQKISDENYENYILMCNCEFLKDKLEWGTSIRGAWLDEYGHHSQKDPTYEIGITGVKIPKKDIKEFCRDLLEWVNG